MKNLRSKNQQISQNQNAVILQKSFNIIFRDEVYFRGANNNQYFFQTEYGLQIGQQFIELFGYQQFVLGGQPKMLKKYNLDGEIIMVLKKSNEYFIIHGPFVPMIMLCKFDRFHNFRECVPLYPIDIDDESESESEWDADFPASVCYKRMMREIGINQNEDIIVFQTYKEIIFYNRDEDGDWDEDQTINSFDNFKMNQIRFNESNDKIIAQQINKNKKHVLTVFNKNTQGIWTITHYIKQINKQEFFLYQLTFRDDLFCFIDNQQFVHFKPSKNIKLIYEISNYNYKAQKMSKGTFQFENTNQYSYDLIEIKSKNLIALGGKFLYFCLKQSNHLKLLGMLQLKNIQYIDYHEDQHSQFLFFKQCYDNQDHTKFQAYRMYVE